jgi:hypothetical protein
MVVDSFISNPDKVRKSALQAGFGTWRPNKGEVGSSVYDGMSFWGDHSILLKGLAQASGQPVYPNSMFFRVTNSDTEAAYVHSDREAGDYTAIVYLSHHDEGTSGTGFYRHRRTGRILMDSFQEMSRDPEEFDRLKHEMVSGSDEFWEQIHLVPGIYNRALIFDAKLFHARLPKNGFGGTAEDGRMVWACHFNL